MAEKIFTNFFLVSSEFKILPAKRKPINISRDIEEALSQSEWPSVFMK
jgi:hypothetical protein